MFAYNVAGTSINVKAENAYMVNRMKAFQCSKHDNPDISLEIGLTPEIKKPQGQLIIEEKLKWLKKQNENEGYHVYNMDAEERIILSHMDVDINWSKASIQCVSQLDEEEDPEFVKDWSDMISFIYTGVVFRNNLLQRGGIVVHASSIAWEGKGLLFTAPSGTGKSTHVGLWERYFGDAVTVVNDDTPAIIFKDEEPILCGTPWSGSSDKFSNLEVPIKAMVVISQAPQNNIRKLDVIEALPVVMPRCFLPYFDEKLMEKAYVALEKMLNKIPVYYLQCRPDREAMELVHQWVK